MSQQQATDQFYEALADDDPLELYERAPCGYLSTTPGGRIVKANATFLTWTGFDLAELTRRSFVDLLAVGDRIYHETHYSPMLRMQGSVREIAMDVVRKDGKRLPVLVNARLDRDADGRPRAVRIAMFDATERRKYERELVRAKERAEQSEERARALARTLQETLIPPSPPSIPHLDLAAAYRPAGDGTEVGGDFYDIFPIAEDDWMVLLGDVCGKGAEAAVVTALVRYTVRATVFASRRPSEVLTRLDELVRRHETDRFCTCVLVRLRRDAEGWTATISSGGHPPPVLVRAGEEPTPLAVRGSLVGILQDPTFRDEEVRLLEGDALLLYTDGVTEARGGGGFFGEEGLLASVRGTSATTSETSQLADRLVSRLVDEVLDYQSGLSYDDVAVVGLVVPQTLA